MGRIKKAAGPKHEATVSRAITTFVAAGSELPISKLLSHIESFPSRWPFPRGDIYHWIPLLNRFDKILGQFTAQYGLQNGPQTQPFGRILLEDCGTELTNIHQELDALGYRQDGDCQLIQAILTFSRLLLENCGNRSLYNSSERINELLNTTDLPLLSDALRLAVRLAQRYHASRQRGANASQHLNTALLASHYSIDLEKVLKLAAPFTKSLAPSTNSPNLTGTPSAKGKEKASTVAAKPVPSTDLLSIAKDNSAYTNGSVNHASATDLETGQKPSWEEWGRVTMSYYQPPPAPKEDKAPATPFPTTPNTPSPTPRRPSGLSRQSRIPSFDDSSDSPGSVSATKPEEPNIGGMRSLDIPSSKIMSTRAEDIIGPTMADIPKESHYELLTKVRVAQGMTKSADTRQLVLGIRLLAITNLAYIYPESIFQQKISQQDSDEPRRLQLAYQLADLIHAHSSERNGIPKWLQTIALGTMEALAKHKAKSADVCAALNVNVSHGVLMHVLRKGVSDMATDDTIQDTLEGDEWRESLFSLLDTLPTAAPRTADSMISAGLLEILVDILNLRTTKAERSFSKILAFLNTTIYTVRDAFQTLANLKGLDAISDLIAHEVQCGEDAARNNQGMSDDYKTHVIDYQVPYFQQQTLRWLLKFVNHMMSHGSGNFDRLLRNLIDSTQLLSGLRTVITNAGIFGSNVWSGAVNIMSAFIHNEPTSFAVIAEAGLSKGLLEAITCRTFPENKVSTANTEAGPSETPEDASDRALRSVVTSDLHAGVASLIANPRTQAQSDEDFWKYDLGELLTPAKFHSMLSRPHGSALAKGILPATDAIVTIPQAFSAICLNNSGKDLFVRSNALATFFEIFESPDHVKSMDNESELARLLGSSFDELVRHHPELRDLVLLSVLSMVIRVGYFCNPKPDPTNGAVDPPRRPLSSTEDVEMKWFDGTPVSATVETQNDVVDKAPKVSSFINVAMKFLSGFFENPAMCSRFAELGGLEFILDFATSESLQYDFSMDPASQEIAKVVHMIAEQKPHLVLPSLVYRTQSEVDALNCVLDHDGESPYFGRFTTPGLDLDKEGIELSAKHVKSLTSVHSLCNILFETFAGPVFNTRATHTVFNQVNLTDKYVALVKTLSRLHRACVWEEILLQKSMPEKWKDATRIKGYGMGSEEADEVFGFIHHDNPTPEDRPIPEDRETTRDRETSVNDFESSAKNLKTVKKAALNESEKTLQFENVKRLRHLLSQIPSSIVPFFQGLAKALVAKRRPESYARQNAYLVAQAMAEATLEQIMFEAPRKTSCAKDRYAYWIVILTSISQLMVEPPLERNHPQCLTLLLQAFKGCGGLNAIQEVLEFFLEEAKSFSSDGSNAKDPIDGTARLTSAYGGIKIILNFYSQIVATKPIIESSQTQTIASNERERGHPHFFSPAQVLVEMRMAILPVVRSMWDSEFVDKASASIIKCIIDILRTILDGGEEQGALRKGDKPPTRTTIPLKRYAIPADKIVALTAKGYDVQKAREGLYRCGNVTSAAEEYCRSQKGFSRVVPHPIPAYDRETPKPQTLAQTPLPTDSESAVPDSTNMTQSNGDEVTPGLRPIEQLLAPDNAADNTHTENGESTPSRSAAPTPAVDTTDSYGEITPAELRSRGLDPDSPEQLYDESSKPQYRTLGSPKFMETATINELDEERTVVRQNLIDRALNLLNVHDEVTFELSDLINSASTKAEDARAMRKEAGETLIQSLISFQMADDFRSSGKQVAACANLLALILQDQDFYDAALEDLKENFSSLLGFIRMFPDQPQEEPSPWIGQILLVLEKILAEDVQPSQIQWTAPKIDEANDEAPVVTMTDPLLEFEDKQQLFTAIVEILPRIGKDESLALSVVRTLVILTRNRSIASQLGEKHNIQRLFLMIKQLAGITSDRLQSSFMLLLRHIVEDDDTIRQIMRSEILANFETRRAGTTDTTGYVRQMYHLALRSPDIFVEITNELVEVKNYDASHQPQNLVLKPEPVVDTLPKDVGASKEGTEQDAETSKASESKDTAQPSTEGASANTGQKAKASESKAPVVQHPSGVVHYLLCELLTYKEVVDKDHAPAAKSSPSLQENPQDPGTDVEMEDSVTPTLAVAPQQSESNNNKKEKLEFKPEQHPIYIYRCFLLQCLTELLRCYNRTKIEFINFSRRADGKAATPSKPRSSVLNYLLNDLIPVGTLNHEESIPFRKKASTSNWAMSAIVSLCLRTDENGHAKKRGSIEEEDDLDLQFVRRFVLEHALKAYKDANASEEALDQKYARLLTLADLFNRLLTGKLVSSSSHSQPSELATGAQKLIARIMYSKEFIAALTGSIADIDLNFPGSKRAVKYILRPLKQLTQTAIVVSETSDESTTPGQTDEDEISTASSVSDLDDDREETPDLFRNTALGMFEPGREEESSSDSSDGDADMYDEEYEEGMDYDDEMERDGDEVVSDEEEEIEGVGPMEGIPGDAGMNVEVVIDEEDEMDEDSDDDDDDDDEEDEEDEMDEMDEDEEIEEVDEITGDDENDSLANGDEEAWQEEGRNPYLDEDEPFNTMHPTDALRDIARDFADPNAIREMAMEMQADLTEEQGEDGEDPEEDEEDEEEGEDVIYQPEYDDDDSGMPDPPWGWDDGDDPVVTMPRRHHHHHHPHRIPSPWQVFPNLGGGGTGDRMPLYRSTRGLNTSRAADDGVNPLLQRSDRAPGGSRSIHTGLSDVAANLSDYWVHGGMEPVQPRGLIDSPVSLISNIIGAIGQGGPGGFAVGGPGGALHFTVGSSRGGLPREIQAVLGLRQAPHEIGRMTSRDDSMQTVGFLPASTPQRWQEEARLLYGNAHAEKAVLVVNSILRLLVPPAIEKEKKRREDEAKAYQLAKEAAEKRLKEEQVAKEAAEKEALEKREKEEADAAAQAEAASSSVPQDQPEGQDGGAMEGVEATSSDEPGTSGANESIMSMEDAAEEAAEAGPSEPAERVVTTIRGRELDITGMGIDIEYLDALPEELREEVLMSQVALQRSEAAAAGQEPTDINREFLEALPPEIREELLQQEAQDRRRREREENRRRAAESGTGPPAARAEEMDTASFLASLDPNLRRAVLMEQDEEMLAQLPQTIAAEARALGSDRFTHRYPDIHRLNRMRGIERPPRVSPPATQKPPRRQIRQMLNKGGVPTLLRLMFIQQQGSSRQSLNGILHDISQNKQNRAEVISLLLSILQDGTADVNAVERSFTSLSLRAKQPTEPKTPQGIKRSLTNQISPLNNSEMTPLMVVQQCLAALVSLTQYNPSIPFFFLTEHEISSANKSKSNRKGKAKENKASKYALNALLSLLDRKLIMESSSCMEQLSSLLQSVTHPLIMLLRKEKEKPEGAEKAEKAIEGPASTENQDNPTSAQAAPNPTQGDVANTSITQPQADREIPSSAQENPPTTAGAPEADAKPSEADKAAEEKAKKPRTLAPPVVPEENLRLVVNIIAARECSGKTFRDTLSTINNLSAIPEAKEVFGKALIEQAKELGKCILHDLNDLVPQIQHAESGSDIQGMALANFSPASSDQAKLLRVLTALDYLFDPKRNEGKTQPVADKKTGNGEASISKEDMLTTLYEHPTFGSLWAKLSECLSAIRQGEGTLSIATILLPLIEALMVVCKNTTIKDAPLVKAAKEFAITTPPPESRIETLFFRFTEDHRKILNDLVRHNPKLMSANFSLLVKNPKVLEFDNKRSYFTRRLHSRGTEARHSQPPLQLHVRRDNVFMDSFPALSFLSADEIKYGKLSVRFRGEEGVDAGGVTREWFQVLSRQMFNPDYALFVPVASDRTTFHPNKLSKVNEEHLNFFKFIGRMIGKALYEGRALDCHFSRAVYKRILGKTVSIKDMETLDLDYYKSLLWMLENDITDIITETFSIETDDFGVQQIVDLKPNGRHIVVTEDNKQEYVQLVVEYRLTGSVQEQLEHFLTGFHDIVPAELIAIFNEQELELLISGLPDIDVDDWKNNTEYHNYSASSAQVQWFWRAVRSFDKEERAKLLQFVTGTSKVPLNGFSQLEGMNGFSRFNIHRDYGNKDRLPSSHTCFNQLDLPEYESYEALRHQLHTAITAGSEYFGFA